MGIRPSQVEAAELTPKHIALLTSITHYTEKEIREWHKGFIKDCPTGQLSKQHFVELYQQLYRNGKVHHYCDHAFATFDKNNDGSIDFDEFLMAMAISNKGNLDDRLGVAFDLYDISHDGQIDQKELAHLLSAMYDLVGETNRKGHRDPKQRAANIIEKLDVSGDKKISKAEFTTGLRNDLILRELLAPDLVI